MKQTHWSNVHCDIPIRYAFSEILTLQIGMDDATYMMHELHVYNISCSNREFVLDKYFLTLFTLFGVQCENIYVEVILQHSHFVRRKCNGFRCKMSRQQRRIAWYLNTATNLVINVKRCVPLPWNTNWVWSHHFYECLQASNRTHSHQNVCSLGNKSMKLRRIWRKNTRSQFI